MGDIRYHGTFGKGVTEFSAMGVIRSVNESRLYLEGEGDLENTPIFLRNLPLTGGEWDVGKHVSIEGYVEDGDLILTSISDGDWAHRIPKLVCPFCKYTGFDKIGGIEYGFRDGEVIVIRDVVPAPNRYRCCNCQGVVNVEGDIVQSIRRGML